MYLLQAPTPLTKIKASQEHTGQSFTLRPYQQQVIEEVYVLLSNGILRILIYAPTGSGKTAIAAALINDNVEVGHRVLFLIHRDSLLDQTQKALRVYGINAGVIKAGHRPDLTRQVQIAAIQTLARRPFPSGINLCVVDEAHTTAFYKTFDRIKEAYPEAAFIGLSASPWRTKSATEYMGQHFDHLIQAPSPAELIKLGFLAPPRYFGFGGLVDLAKIDNGSDGDFHTAQLQTAYMAEGVNERIVREFVKLAGDRTAICFCAGVEQSKLITQLFIQAGTVAEHLDASTQVEERTLMYERLRSGKTRILSSVGVLTEGFDVPSIGAIILARATRSRALLFQMCGRGLRLYQEKKDCLLLDFGENFKRLGFITSKQSITLEPVRPESDPSTKECPACHAQIYTFQMCCPECGFVFLSNRTTGVGFADFEIKFGELFPPEHCEKLKYLRKQIRSRYTAIRTPEGIRENFRARYGYLPPDEWHLGAIFGSKRTEVNRQLYLDYLRRVKPNAIDLWYRFHFGLEFGFPGRRYKVGRGTYTASPSFSPLELKTWWEVLDVLPLSDWSEIKTAYIQLSKLYHPDSSNLSVELANELMKLVNWAFEKAKEARNI